MTPARIAEIAESAWNQWYEEPLDDKLALERAIRTAVNEFADEVERKMREQFDREAKAYAHYSGDWQAAAEWHASRLTATIVALEIVRALKLPEE